MSLLEQQNVLAKLYTDEKFREKFIAEPNSVGKESKLDRDEIAEIIEILPDEILAFADSLFYKRFREVERLLPLTRKYLAEEFEKSFRNFIKDFNPQTVKKHHEDTIEFAKFIQRQEVEKDWIKDVARLERSKLEFGGFGKMLIVNKFDYDLRDIYHRDIKADSKLNKRRTFGIWINLGKFHKHLMF